MLRAIIIENRMRKVASVFNKCYYFLLIPMVVVGFGLAYRTQSMAGILHYYKRAASHNWWKFDLSFLHLLDYRLLYKRDKEQISR